VQAAWKRLQRAGQQQLAAVEREIHTLNTQRQALLGEISTMIGGGTARGRAAGASRGGRRGRRARIDWDGVFARLPKGSFRAGDVRKLTPGVAPGTLGQGEEAQTDRVAPRDAVHEGGLSV
jgi:hypothetical protein